MKHILVVLLLLYGCATTTREPPSTFQELKKETIRSLENSCLVDIFWGRNLSYPLTDFRTYHFLRDLGIDGPSPAEWCRLYARERVV